MRILMGLVVLAVLSTTGCEPLPMSNDQVIAEVKKCHDAGMEARIVEYGDGHGVHHVECSLPKDRQ